MQCANDVKLEHGIVEKINFYCYLVDNATSTVENQSLNVNYLPKTLIQQESNC